MTRRDFIALLGGAAATWPLAARAAAADDTGDRACQPHFCSEFCQSLVSLSQGTGKTGYVEGRKSLKLFDIKCAWFNENQYWEFFPRKLFTGSVADSL